LQSRFKQAETVYHVQTAVKTPPVDDLFLPNQCEKLGAASISRRLSAKDGGSLNHNESATGG